MYNIYINIGSVCLIIIGTNYNVREKLKHISLILIVLLSFSFVFAGCTFNPIDFDIDSGYDEEDNVESEPDYDFNITSSLNSITIKVSGVGDVGTKANLVSLNPYQYLYGEENTGLSDDIVFDPQEVTVIEGGEDNVITLDRYDIDGNDGVYKKYYVLDDAGDIMVGPMYCTDIEPISKDPDPTQPTNLKGLMCDDRYTDRVTDLGCSYTEINFLIDNMIVPNELYNESTGLITPINYREEKINGQLYIHRLDASGNDVTTEKAESIIYNGKKYYFRTDNSSYLPYYDSLIKTYTSENVRMTIIMLMHNVANKYIQPYFLTYPATASVSKSKYVQLNTANEYGAGYWAAFMEFLGNRYCTETANFKYGRVQTYVIGNEIDLSGSWNNIVSPTQSALSLNDYVEEYERQMRIANMALKKYCKETTVLVSISHYWAGKGGDYSVKEILDLLCKKTLKEGNYNWGIAAHPYGRNLTVPNFWYDDVAGGSVNGSLTSFALTWTNLEILQLYLEQSAKRYFGNVRDVYITEGGVSSSSPIAQETLDLQRRQQAAGITYIYYKCANLSCIKALIYYRLIDNPGESAYFGLYTYNMEVQKPAYDVYKYVDTQHTQEEFIDGYLKEIGWAMNGITYGKDAGNVSTWKDVMGICPSRFDWNAISDEQFYDNIITRIVD